MGRPPNPQPSGPALNFYGLERLGYADIPLTGSYVRDQFTIESICFRIGLRPEEGGLSKFGHAKRMVELLWNNDEVGSSKKFIHNAWSDREIRAFCEYDEVGVAGASSSGKCLHEDTLVQLSDGNPISAKKVQVGMWLAGDDGNSREVLKVSRGREKLFRIIPEEGEPWLCTGAHRLVLRTAKGSIVYLPAAKAAEWFAAYPGVWFQYRVNLHGVHIGSTPITVEPAEEGNWVGIEVNGNHHHLLADGTVTHNSDPASLWAILNYIADPTHTLVLILSTTLGGAKKRIWKSALEYWTNIPDLPGRLLKSTNEIKGLSYNGKDYGDSSGIYLLASEQSNEKDALNKLIGIKAPRTGRSGAAFEELMKLPEYEDLVDKFDETYLRDLLPRLQNLSDDRIGKIILIIDEANGCAPSILNVWRSNMKPGNSGHAQCIMLANPAELLDPFGLFCQPADGWENITVNDEEWPTATGGVCIRLNGERNPRITEGNERLSWMLREKDIAEMERTYGRNSLYFMRFVTAMWSPHGTDDGVYNQSDFVSTGAMGPTVWGFKPPIWLSTLDPSFSAGGDRASCTFFKFGLDSNGKKVIERVEEISIIVDIENTSVPVSYQMVRKWKEECQKRNVTPNNAAFDATGGGITFADVVRVVWSSQVLAITSAGKPSKTPVGREKHPNGDPVLCSERYSNRATEIWFGAHPLLRSGQIKGITIELAKQICSRQHDKGYGKDARVLKIENKRTYKARVGSSPDESDSFFLGPELAKTRHGFTASEEAAVDTSSGVANSTWKKLCQRAMKISGAAKKRLG